MRVAMSGTVGMTAIALVVVASVTPVGAQAAGSPQPGTSASPSRTGYTAPDLRRDLAAVRAAGGGDVNVVARVDGPQGALRARYGTAGTGSKAPVPWDAQFRVASTTKTFTAVVVLQLVAEGRLSLGDTVEHWLPGVVGGNGNDGSRITVRDLLQQSSGVYDYITDPDVQDRIRNGFEENRYDATPAGELVAIAMRHRPCSPRDRRARHVSGHTPTPTICSRQ